MELLGTIVRLQVQRSSLKVGPPQQHEYSPAPILDVPAISIDRGGVTAQDKGGTRLIDIHHRDHPATKNLHGRNGHSVLFTPHYAMMRQRFGPHLVDGIAGESILVETDRTVSEEDLRDGLAIQTEGALVRLYVTKVAEPCVEFTRFAVQYPPDARSDRTVTEALDFLRGGMRGFYLEYSGEPVTLHVGDTVFL